MHAHFQMCPKLMTPHFFDYKNVTEGNMIPKQKWSHMTWEILDKTINMTLDCNMCDLCPQLTFDKLFANVTCNCGM